MYILRSYVDETDVEGEREGPSRIRMSGFESPTARCAVRPSIVLRSDDILWFRKLRAEEGWM